MNQKLHMADGLEPQPAQAAEPPGPNKPEAAWRAMDSMDGQSHVGISQPHTAATAEPGNLPARQSRSATRYRKGGFAMSEALTGMTMRLPFPVTEGSVSSANNFGSPSKPDREQAA